MNLNNIVGRVNVKNFNVLLCCSDIVACVNSPNGSRASLGFIELLWFFARVRHKGPRYFLFTYRKPRDFLESNDSRFCGGFWEVRSQYINSEPIKLTAKYLNRMICNEKPCICPNIV